MVAFQFVGKADAEGHSVIGERYENQNPSFDPSQRNSNAGAEPDVLAVRVCRDGLRRREGDDEIFSTAPSRASDHPAPPLLNHDTIFTCAFRDKSLVELALHLSGSSQTVVRLIFTAGFVSNSF